VCFCFVFVAGSKGGKQSLGWRPARLRWPRPAADFFIIFPEAASPGQSVLFCCTHPLNLSSLQHSFVLVVALGPGRGRGGDRNLVFPNALLKTTGRMAMDVPKVVWTLFAAPP